jgi:hypothetical protein
MTSKAVQAVASLDRLAVFAGGVRHQAAPTFKDADHGPYSPYRCRERLRRGFFFGTARRSD